jgi:hypothetical protein
MKTKFAQNLISLLIAFVFAFYPLSFAANVAHALPSLPGTPDTPTLPDSPEDPDTPTLPGEEESSPVGTSNSDSPDSTDGGGGDVGSSNSNTGADSTNTSDTTIDNNTDVGLNNDADIDNIVDVDAVSGDNNADENTGDGNVSTGDAAIDGSVKTDANTLNIGALECSTECDVIDIASLESGNSSTGAGSDNASSTDLSNDSDLALDNDADLNNLVMFDADTGDNSASLNTGNGTIDTGDADIILTAINAANNVNVGYEVFNVFDDQTGDIVINFDDIAGTSLFGSTFGSSNDTTGADSDNSAATSVDNSNTILIDNDGNIVNNYVLDANTGDNTTDKNTGDGSITTGDANVALNLINFLNNVFLGGGGELLLGVVNIFGTLDGDIVLTGLDGPGGVPYNPYLSSSNSATGADSDNDASVSSTNDADITLANSADILNNITLDANTGDNDTDKNTGSGQISTGNTNANLNLANIANNTGIGDGGTIWMVLVNNLGNWSGQLFDTDSSSGAYSPFFTFTIGADGSLSASNQNTGAGSTNDASTSVENDTDIAVTNNAVVTNNVMIDANTGNNSASKNTGSGTISTGDASIAANIVNMVNNVFLSGRFALTIVNVFGNFLGDIRQDTGAIGAVTVDQSESVAITPSKVTTTPNLGSVSGFDQQLGSNPSQSDKASKDSNDSTLVLSASDEGDSVLASIAHFSTDPGLFDDFKLWYLIFPVIFGTVFTFIRRAINLRR